jgi:hypothetical protein
LTIEAVSLAADARDDGGRHLECPQVDNLLRGKPAERLV